MDTLHLEQLLKSRDIAPTAMRLLILNELVSSKVAVSMQDLESSMERSDKVTIYRTLKTFQKHKLVHGIDDGTGSIKYALCAEDCECSPADFHAHFHCNECNGTFCLNDYVIPAIGLPVKFTLEEMSIVLKGKCENCSAQ